MSTPPDLIARIERLERENRRWKLALGTGLVATAAACFASFQNPAPKELVAQRFVLQGADGTEYGSLELDGNENPMLQLRKDKARAALTLSGPSFLLRGPDGVRSVFLGIDSKGATRAELTGQSTYDGLRLVVQPDGSAGVYAHDEKGTSRAGLEALATGHATISVRDAEANVRGTLGADPQGNSSMLLLDAQERRRIGSVVDAEGIPTLSMEDGDNRPRANLTMGYDGAPRFELLRENGQPIQRLP